MPRTVVVLVLKQTLVAIMLDRPAESLESTYDDSTVVCSILLTTNQSLYLKMENESAPAPLWWSGSECVRLMGFMYLCI